MNDVSLQSPETGEKMKRIPLMEIFGPTIQGEGQMIGQQTYFIRFGLCDYKCTMCDSMFAVDPRSVMAHGRRLTELEIAQEFLDQHKRGSSKWVTFSGGNPCIHDLTHLVEQLTYNQFKIAVETQGTLCPPWLAKCDVVTISPKGPGMGEILELDKLDKFVNWCMQWYRSSRGQFQFNIKVVVFDQRDLEIALELFHRYTPAMSPSQFYLSLGNPFPPGKQGADTIEHGAHMQILVDNYLRLWEDIQYNVTLSQMKFLPQWHVFLWGNAKGK